MNELTVIAAGAMCNTVLAWYSVSRCVCYTPPRWAVPILMYACFILPLRPTRPVPRKCYKNIFIKPVLTFLSTARQPLVGQGLSIIEASRSHSDTPHKVGLLWTSGQPDAGTSTWQYTTLTRERVPCRLQDSNPRSQQSSGRRLTP
jgi:hypothetical protein